MKIAFVCSNVIKVTGLNRILIQKMNLLADDSGYDVTLITYNQYDRPYSFDISDKVRHIDLGTRYLAKCAYRGLYQYVDRYRSKRVLVKALTDCLCQVDSDVIVCVDVNTIELNTVLRAPVKAIRVVECHRGRAAYYFDYEQKSGMLARFWVLRKSKAVERLIRQFDKVVLLTHKEQSEWNIGDHAVRIPNMLISYPPKEHNYAEMHHRVISVGRLAYQKNYEALLAAWKLVGQKYADWQLDVYGSQDEWHPNLVSLQAEMKLDTVAFHAPDRNIYSYYQNSDFCVMSSRYESFGLVFIEAMACGLPVVTFDCPYGPSEIIRHGETGLLVPNGRIDKLAESICYLIEHPEECQRMGRNARQDVKKYLPEAIMPLWHRFYGSLVY